MNYRIDKITIDEEASWKLIKDIIAEVNKIDASVLDRRKVEFFLYSDDDLIDIWFNVEFYSEYRQIDGGVETVCRSISFDIWFTYNPTGDEIEVEIPISIEDEIKEHFRIDGE